MTRLKLLLVSAALCGCSSLPPAPNAGQDALGRLKELSAAAEAYRAARGRYASPRELAAGTDRLLSDPWGTEHRLEVFPESKAAAKGIDYQFRSAGPDRGFGTDDDLAWPPEAPDPRRNITETKEQP